MKTMIKIRGTAPLSFSRPLRSVMDKEDGRAFEEKVFVERLHLNGKGQVCVPRTALKNMLGSTASYLGDTVPGGGKRTYTKLFKSSVIISDDPVVMVNGKPVTVKDTAKPGQKDKPIGSEWVYAHSDGKRNGTGSRVWRLFPEVDNWELSVDVEVHDQRITDDVLLRHFVAAGIYNGLGRHRPQNEGDHGRFEVVAVDGTPYTPKDGVVAPSEDAGSED